MEELRNDLYMWKRYHVELLKSLQDKILLLGAHLKAEA